MTPEEKARRNIDRRLAACGWVVQDRDEMDITAGPGVAVGEFPLESGEADYLLYAEGRVIDTVEAKPEGNSLSGVEGQSSKYVHSLPTGVPSHRLPLPFHCESTGRITQFTNLVDPDARSREVFALHRPGELLRLVGPETQLRAALRAMPRWSRGDSGRNRGSPSATWRVPWPTTGPSKRALGNPPRTGQPEAG
jgi:type I restriction enzyme R subunit